MLTVTGYGGTGKTRFAIELFRRLEQRYPGGPAFVSVASVTDPGEVLPTVAASMDIAEAHGRTPLDAICTVIGERPMLLVLDNLEQVLDAAGDLAAMVGRCPGLQIVATSRAPLKIGAESEFPLPPLELPALATTTVDTLLACPSVELFVERARRVQPAFHLSEANAPAVAEICRRLDGLPLALELAAARIRVLEPAALLERLDHALDLLTSGDRDLPLRQRTLRTTISWSYSLLSPEEQGLLRRLSVFHEGWTLAAVEGVCYGADERHRALDELDSLVEKGLVRVVGLGERYSLLETIRAFAAEQLHAGGDVEAVRQAHADHFVTFAAEVDAGIRDERQLDAMRRARVESANTMAAAQWLTGRARLGDLDAVEAGLLLCGHLCWPWHIHGLHLTGRSLLDVFQPLAAQLPPSRGRCLAGLAGAMTRGSTGDWDWGMLDADRAHADATAIADEAAAAEAAMHQGYIHLSQGRMAEAGAALDDAAQGARSSGAEFILGISLAIRGMLRFLAQDLEGGQSLVEQALDIQRRIGDCEGRGLSLSFLAQMAFAQADHARAVATFRHALAAFETVGDRPEIARLHCEMGWAALRAGEGEEAQRAFEMAVHTYEEVGSPRGHPYTASRFRLPRS